MWRPSVASQRSSPSPPLLSSASVGEQKPQPPSGQTTTPSPQSTLAEALKNNPFKSVDGSSRKTRAPIPPEDDPVTLLNNDLKKFANIYPDVKIEVLRELLVRFDGDSRLHICTEQLLRFKSEWAKGRLLNPPRDPDEEIPVEDAFRSKNYAAASKQTLTVEFRSVNKSAVDAVLAEVNQSYTKARPILQEIAAKSWRATLTSLFKRRKAIDEVPSFLVDKRHTEAALRSTGDSELDQELELLFFTTARQQRQHVQEQADRELALNLNQQEAEEAQALFECQVCYNDVPFELLVTCTANAHPICRDCVAHSLSEALFGQGWAKSIDTSHGTLCCVALDGYDECPGHISPELLRGTILSTEAGQETWNKFEQRLAMDNIMKSGLSLKQCPFCHYGEAPFLHALKSTHLIKWRFRDLPSIPSLLFFLVLLEFFLPTFLLIITMLCIICPGRPRKMFDTSLIHLHAKAQTLRFRCKNPTCGRTSCLSCSKSWHDPHTCHEPLIISLRTAVEAARTSALKRTCPRCGMSFVKSSGCNKLTCICGYAMCYICRKNIGRVNTAGAVDDREGGEGYRHFCEHFRPLPGQKCTECDKCDLYKSEDEEALVRQAGEQAEREWREREGMVGVKSLGLEQAVDGMGRLGKDDDFAAAWHNFIKGNWTFQGVCDAVVNKILVVEN